jgi:hypothetical protein
MFRDFEFLYARPVNAGAAFIGENRPFVGK